MEKDCINSKANYRQLFKIFPHAGIIFYQNWGGEGGLLFFVNRETIWRIPILHVQILHAWDQKCTWVSKAYWTWNQPDTCNYTSCTCNYHATPTYYTCATEPMGITQNTFFLVKLYLHVSPSSVLGFFAILISVLCFVRWKYCIDYESIFWKGDSSCPTW